MRLRHILLSATAALAVAIGPRTSRASYDMENEIGCVHIAGIYYFGSTDYMDQGVSEVAALGTHLIKTQLDKYTLENTWNSNAKYCWNSAWPAFSGSTTLSSIAQTQYYKNLFSNSTFTKYILTTYSPNVSYSGDDGTGYWYNGGNYPTSQNWLYNNSNSEYNQVKNLSSYLLANYSGKTFVIEQWEGDNALRDLPTGSNVTYNDCANMVDWINARCKGVHDAMAAKGSSTSKVYCALEVNKVADAINEGGSYTSRTATDDVLPFTNVDYASYSAYDSQMITSGSYSFQACCNQIIKKMPSTVIDGNNLASLGVGEFGASRWETSSYSANTAINNVLPQVINGNMPYCMYWDIYDNDLQTTTITPPVNGNDTACLGFWMIKPDATPSTAWHDWRWQCITNDSVRSNGSTIKAGLTKTYTSSFTTSGLGTGWTTSFNTTYYHITYNAGNVNLQLTNGGSTFPSAVLKLGSISSVSSKGRGLQPGDYLEYSIWRNGTGFIGSEMFNSTATGCDDGSGNQPWTVYTGTGSNGWTPISWTWNTEPTWGGPSPTYNFNTTNTLGMRIDSADGQFATISFYLDTTGGGSPAYIGSWLYPTSTTTLNTFSMFCQDGNSGTEQFDFGNVSIYQK